jgi:AcrR family transcriptional regulator
MVRSPAALVMPATRRRLNGRQADTVRRVIDAACAELRDVGFDALTVRSVASRARVAPATAYTYFSSKNHLVVEILWQRINDLPRREEALPSGSLPSAQDRVIAVFEDLAALLAAEPELAAATAAALLGADPDVRQLRHLIGTEINARIRDALADEASPDLLDALSLAWSGAMLQAGMGHSDYKQMGARLATAARLIIAERV